MSEANLLLREDGYPHLKDWLSSQALDTGRNKPRGALEALRRENDLLRETIDELTAALMPFSNCIEWIDDSEDDEEWAKFRLLVVHYRRAHTAVGKASDVKGRKA